MTGSNDKVLVRVTHHFDASAERVYDAFLDPRQARKFMFATATGQIVRCDIDARVGGTFTIVDRRRGEDVTHSGGLSHARAPSAHRIHAQRRQVFERAERPRTRASRQAHWFPQATGAFALARVLNRRLM